MGAGWRPVLLHSSVSSCGAASSALQPDKHVEKCKYVIQLRLLKMFAALYVIFFSFTLCPYLHITFNAGSNLHTGSLSTDTLMVTHLSLLLMQLPRQLFYHLLLFHQHLVFFSFHTIHTSTFPGPQSSPAQTASSQAVLHVELGRRWLQGELCWRGHGDVAEAVGERAAEGQLGGGRRDGRGGGGAGVRVVASLGQGAGGGWGLVGGQGPCWCDREGHCGDVRGARGRGASVRVLERSESIDEGRLGAGDGHAANTQVLPELRYL